MQVKLNIKLSNCLSSFPIKINRVISYKKFSKYYFEIFTRYKLKTLIDTNTKKLYEKAKKI